MIWPVVLAALLGAPAPYAAAAPGIPSADLANVSVIAAGPASVVPGRVTRLRFEVTNAGPGSATRTRLTVTMPYLAKASGEGCQSGRDAVTCSLGEVSHGETRTLTVQAKIAPAAIGPVTVKATASTETQDLASADDTSTVVIATKPRADLEIRSRVGRVSAGRAAVYTFTVLNHGPSWARRVRIFDKLHWPLTAIKVSGKGCKLWRNGLRCHWAHVREESRKITMRVTVSGKASGKVTNWITIRAATPDPVLKNNRTKLTVPIDGGAQSRRHART